MNRIRIVFLIHTLESGGAEGQLVEWLRALPPEEFDRRVVCLVKGGFHEAEVREMGVPVDVLGYRPMRRADGSLDVRAALTFVPAFFRLIGILRRFRPYVLQTVLLMSDAMGALAVRLLRPRPVLAGSRLALSDCAPLGGVRQRMVRWAVRSADVILCNADVVARDVARNQGADPSRLATIYNGVDVGRFERARAARGRVRSDLGLSEDERAIGCVAQLRPEKDHDTLVQAFAEVKVSHPRIRLFLAGGGPREAAIRETARSLDVEESVRFLGVRKDVPELMAAFDLLVLPSRTEGFSNVILEGMAAGLPIVATEVGGTPEALEEGRCGLLTPPGDPKALAEAMGRFLDSPDLARQTAAAARERAGQKFSLEALHRDLRRFYSELAGRKGGGKGSG